MRGDSKPSPVVLIHGICSRGRWYDSARRALAPWYEPIEVRYKDYERYGFFKVASELGGIVLSLFLLGTWFAADRLSWWSPEVRSATLVSSLAVLPVGIGLAIWEAVRRRRTGRAVQSQIEDAFAGRPLHAIAHSFGTLQFRKALRRLPYVTYKRVILCGCVLPRRVRWDKEVWRHSSNEPALWLVRNEIGAKDWIVRLAWIAAWLRFVRGTGRAGQSGFWRFRAKLHRLVHHQVREPLGPCVICRPKLPKHPRVHDVQLDFYGHSSMFRSEKHAQALWLPVLWGLDPGDAVHYGGKCACLADADEDHGEDSDEFDEAYRALATQKWGWSRHRDRRISLQEFVELRLALKRPDFSDDDVESAARTVILAVARRVRAAVDGGQGAIRRELHPKRSVLNGIRDYLQGALP